MKTFTAIQCTVKPVSLSLGLGFKKVKCAIPHEECRWGAHLPFLGLEVVDVQTTEVCDAWPVRRQTYLRLPSQPQYSLTPLCKPTRGKDGMENAGEA